MSEADSQGTTIETRIPARLDRLPWPRFHRVSPPVSPPEGAGSAR